MSNQLSVIGLVEGQEQLFMPALSDDSIKWNKEKQFAIQALQNNDYLAKIAMGNQLSFQNAIINIASIGISLNPANKHAYLVPRDGRVCLDISYMGLLHLAMSTGSIMWGQCKLVKANDSYANNGLDKAPSHISNTFGDRGEVVGGYCTVKTMQGDYLTEEMSLEEIHAIRQRSKGFQSGKNTPWKTDHDEMCRKTIVKRGSKYWPTGDRLNTAINHLNTDNDEGIAMAGNEPVDITAINNDQCDQLNSLIDKSGRNSEQFCAWATMMFKRKIDSISELRAVEFDKSYNMVKNA